MLTVPATVEGIDLFIWGNAESCVTIVAASIPVLRVLLREVGTTAKRYYHSNGTGHTDGQLSTQRSKLRSAESTAVGTTWSATRTFMTTNLDNRSEKSFTGVAGGGQGKIVRTSELAVEYHDAKNGAGNC